MSDELRREWLNVFEYLKAYFVNPIAKIRNLPDWQWQTLLFLCGILGAISGSLNGLISGQIINILLGFLLTPLTLTVAYFVISGFFYYFFQFVLGRQINFKQIFTLMTLANIPFLAMFIISPLASPLSLIGVAASGVLLIVGFIDYFMLPKKAVVRLIISMFAFHLIMWIWGSIQIHQEKIIEKSSTTRENLDILERELKGN